MKINLIINDQTFLIDLEANNVTRELRKKFPLSLKMDDLHGNEKYVYLSEGLPTETQKIDRIERGDVLLFGTDCLVVFYKSFDTQYSYSRIGKIRESDKLDFLEDVDTIQIELGIAE